MGDPNQPLNPKAIGCALDPPAPRCNAPLEEFARHLLLSCASQDRIGNTQFQYPLIRTAFARSP